MQVTNTDGGALSAAFTTTTGAVHRMVIAQVYIKWDGHNWTDESDNLMGHAGVMQESAPGDPDLLAAGDVGQATITLRNAGWRYSELSTRGDATLRSTVLAESRKLRGLEVRLYQGFYTSGTREVPADAEYVQIFYGVIYDWDEDSAQKTITLLCRDIGQKYLQQRANTAVQQDQRIDTWIGTMADEAGVPAGDRTLDVALYTIPWIWMADESPIEEIWTAAQAEAGRVYFDHHGKLVFENALHWLDHTSSVWTFDEGDLANLVPNPQTDKLATKVQAEWSPRQEATTTEIYKLEEMKICRPGQTITFDIVMSRPVVRWFELEAEKDFQIINSAGGNMNADCTLTIEAATRYAQRATVTLVNNHGYYSAMLIFLHVRGTLLIGGNSQEVTIDVDPAPLDFTQTRWVRGNMLIQTDSHARALATALAEGICAEIRREWALTGVRGVPQLELGDRITFSDDRQVGSTRDGLVTRINWTMTESGGFSQDLVAIDAEDLFPYDDYFTIGVDTLGNNERCYY